MANNERVVDLVVRAKDQYSKVLANLKQQQQQIAESGRKTQLQFSTTTRAELAKTQAEIKNLAGEFRTLTSTQGASRAEIGQLVIAKAKLQAKAGELKAALTGVERATHQVKLGQQGSFAEFVRNTSALQGETAAANATATALKKVEVATKGVATAQLRSGSGAPMSMPAAGNRRRGNSGGRRGESQDVELYGLKPYQMVNLGYQVNDVISGLAMGQAPLQILAQQAGQFAQIWPDMMVGLVRSIPQIAALGAVFAPLIGGIVEATSRSRALEEFSRRLSTMAEGSRYAAEELTKISRNFEELKPLLESGFSQDSLKGFYDLSKTLSNANGKSVAENVQDLATAFGGGVEGVRALDRELNFLTVDQLKQIRTMEEQGDTVGALKVAQDALRTSFKSFSDMADGPWSRAGKKLGDTWRDLMKWMSNTFVVGATIGVFKLLGNTIEWLAEKMQLLVDMLPQNEDPITSVGNQADFLRKEVERIQNWADNSGSLPPGWTQKMFDDLKAELSDAERLLGEMNERKEESIELGTIELESTQEAKKLIEDQLFSLEEEARLAQMTERARFQELEVIKAKNKAMQEGLTLGAEELARLRDQAGLTYDASNSGVSGNLIDKITGVESGGNASAKNPNSSATGLGQFIASTWLRMFRQYFPDRAAGMAESAILELRKDADLSRKITELYILENKKNLERFGIAVTDASIYLSHFLGPGGAVKLLKASPDTPVSDILGADQINANQSILSGKTAGEVLAWAQKKMGISNEEVEVTTRLIELDEERVETAKEYDEAYRERIEQQQFELDNLTKSARAAAIAKAVRDEELIAQKAGLELTAERRAEVERIAAANFDNANAETRVNELMEHRAMLMESLTLAQEAGDESAVSRIITEIGETEEELNSAIDAAIRFYEAMGGPAAEAAILKLQNMKGAVGDIVRDMSTQYLPTAEALNDQIVDMGGNAFSAFAEAIATGENAWEAFKNAMIQGLADIVISIGKAIVQQALFNALTGGGTNPGGGIGGTIAGWVSGLFMHSGGIVGRGAGSGSRMVNPAVFAGAERFHSGGVLGLGPNEKPIIGLKDEEMLTRDDPRHVLNGGKNGKDSNVKILNVFNPVDLLEMALADEDGQRVYLNFATRNARKLQGAAAT